MPTGYTPYYMVIKGSDDVTANFNDRCISMKFTFVSGGGNIGDLVEVSFDDRDWAIAYPVVGDQIEFHLGYKEVGLAYMGRFEINKVTFHGPPRTITIEGTSTGAMGLMKAPKVKDYSGKTLGDILNDLAGISGVQAQVDSDLSSRPVPFRNMITSPLHMVHELERMYGAVAKLQDGKLIFAKREGGNNTTGVAIPVITLTPQHFGEWQVMHTDRTSYAGVRAMYQDKDSYFPTPVDIQNPIQGLGNAIHKIGRVFNSKDEAQAAAQAQMYALNRSQGIGVFVLAKGDPWIRDQQRIQVVGMRDGINGSYLSQRVVHSYRKDTGIQTVISADGDGEGADYGIMEGLQGKSIDLKPGQLLGEALKDNPEFQGTGSGAP